MFFRTCLQSKGVTARLGLRQAETANLCNMTSRHKRQQDNVTTLTHSTGFGSPHHVCCQAAEVMLFLLWRAQFGYERVDQRVLDVTEHGHGRIHLRQLLDDQDGREECGASAAIFWFDLDAHEL